MNTMSERIDLAALQSLWAEFSHISRLRALRCETDYDHAVSLMDQLIDAIGEDEQHPLAGLLDLISDLVMLYDRKHFALFSAESKA
jgi:HTH-type transcriptional regulator/antitoxin HigA